MVGSEVDGKFEDVPACIEKSCSTLDKRFEPGVNGKILTSAQVIISGELHILVGSNSPNMQTGSGFAGFND